jgi:acid phosphatase type 7
VFALGDNQYQAGALEEFQAVYGPTWGRFKPITYPVPGNHEYGRANARGYFDYFGARAGPRPQGWYSFNLGSWHILAINSECHRLPAGTCAVGGAQETFVRNDLRANPRHCTLAFWHEPRFASGSVASTNEQALAPIWNDLIDIGKVDVVVVGHKHFYERLAPLGKTGAVDLTRGIRSFIVGTGGDDHSGNPAPRVGSEVRNAKTFGVIKLGLNTGGYTWRFVGEPGSTFTDSGSGTCH